MRFAILFLAGTIVLQVLEPKATAWEMITPTDPKFSAEIPINSRFANTIVSVTDGGKYRQTSRMVKAGGGSYV